MDTMTPDQFFDALDELFGTDDGYVNHLKRIKNLIYQNEKQTERNYELADFRRICDIKLKLPFLTAELLGDEIDKLKEEIEELKNDLRLCADGLIPHGMVGGIVETEREKRHKAEKENKKLKKENKELQEHYDNSIHTDWIAEAAGEDAEDYRNVCCADTLGKMIKENKKLKEGLAQKFYKHYDEMDYDKMYIAKTVGPDLGKMVDHLMEENKKLKEAQR